MEVDYNAYSELVNGLKTCTNLTQIPTSIFSDALTTTVSITNGISYCDFYHQLDLPEESKFKS